MGGVTVTVVAPRNGLSDLGLAKLGIPVLLQGCSATEEERQRRTNLSSGHREIYRQIYRQERRAGSLRKQLVRNPPSISDQ
jgi:hypothetical protein